ncbi:hypothetical protein OROMI_033180 [Orobanche minor]
MEGGGAGTEKMRILHSAGGWIGFSAAFMACCLCSVLPSVDLERFASCGTFPGFYDCLLWENFAKMKSWERVR